MFSSDSLAVGEVWSAMWSQGWLYTGGTGCTTGWREQESSRGGVSMEGERGNIIWKGHTICQMVFCSLEVHIQLNFLGISFIKLEMI